MKIFKAVGLILMVGVLAAGWAAAGQGAPAAGGSFVCQVNGVGPYNSGSTS